MDTVYPEPLSRLHKRAVRKKVHGNVGRYKTQPITFSEIQEVDEETAGDEVSSTSLSTASKSELDLKAKFEEFKRQRDRDLRESRLNANSSVSISFEAESIGRKSRSQGLEGVSGGCSNNDDKDSCTDFLRIGSTIR